MMKLKKMLVSLLVVFVAVPFILAEILDKKNIKNVQTVALVSVTSPRKILYYNHDKYLDSNQDKTEMNGSSWAPKEQVESELQSLCDFTAQTISARLAEIPQWKFVNVEAMKGNAAYQTFSFEPKVVSSKKGEMPDFLKKLALKAAANNSNKNSGFGGSDEPVIVDFSSYRAGTGMPVIPMAALTDGAKRWGNVDPFKVKREMLAQLARDLNVDAVIVVESVVSYRYGKAASLRVGENVKAVPLANCAMMMISKDGKIVANTGVLRSKLNMDYEGTSVTISRQSKLMLSLPETRAEFETPIKLSADRLKDVLTDAYAKLK